MFAIFLEKMSLHSRMLLIDYNYVSENRIYNYPIGFVYAQIRICWFSTAHALFVFFTCLFNAVWRIAWELDSRSVISYSLKQIISLNPF